MEWLAANMPSAEAVTAFATLGTLIVAIATFVLMHIKHRNDALRGSVPTVSHTIRKVQYDVVRERWTGPNYDRVEKYIDSENYYFAVDVVAYLDAPPHWLLVSAEIVDFKKERGNLFVPPFIDMGSRLGGAIVRALDAREAPPFYEAGGLKIGYSSAWGGELVLSPDKPMKRTYIAHHAEQFAQPLKIAFEWRSMGYPPRTLRPVIHVDLSAH